NLALQAAVYAAAPAGQTGVATGLFQTCRYLGAILSTALLGIAFEHAVSSAGLHRISWTMLVVAALLTVAAAGAGHVGSHRGGAPVSHAALAADRRHLLEGAWTDVGRRAELADTVTARPLAVADDAGPLTFAGDHVRAFAKVGRERGHELLPVGDRSGPQ